MMTGLVIVFQIILVTAVYWTAYRTGYKACAYESRRQAAANAAPLVDILEGLNLDAEALIGDRSDDQKE